MTQEKRYRIDDIKSSYTNKRINIDSKDDIINILKLFENSIADNNIEEMNKYLKNLNEVEITEKVLVQLIELDLINIFKSFLTQISIDIDINNQEIAEILKLFLNILLDISDLNLSNDFNFDDNNKERNNDETNDKINLNKLKILLDKDLHGLLICILMKLEEKYLHNLKNNELKYENLKLIQESILLTYFQLLEIILEINPTMVSENLLKFQSLFNWLIEVLDNDNLEIDEISGNKIEILSIIFQNVILSKIDNITFNIEKLMDSLLIKLAYLGLKEEITGIKNREFVYNLVDIICNLLLDENQRLIFYKLEGIELMIKFMREKIFLRPLSVKIISFILLSNSEINNKFVDLLGLKPIFALLTYSIKDLEKNRLYNKTREQKDIDEHICSIIKSLLYYCKGNELKRVLKKLTEDNHLKLKILMKLRIYYTHEISKVLEDEDSLNNNIEVIETLAINAGLFTVQLIDIIIIYTLYYEKINIKDYEKNTLNQFGILIEDIINSIEDYSELSNEEEKTFIRNIRSSLNI